MNWENKIKKLLPYFIVFSLFIVIEIIISFKSQSNAVIYSHSYFEEITLTDVKYVENKIILYFKDHKNEVLEAYISRCKLDIGIGDTVKMEITEDVKSNGERYKSPFDVIKHVCHK